MLCRIIWEEAQVYRLTTRWIWREWNRSMPSSHTTGRLGRWEKLMKNRTMWTFWQFLLFQIQFLKCSLCRLVPASQQTCWPKWGRFPGFPAQASSWDPQIPLRAGMTLLYVKYSVYLPLVAQWLSLLKMKIKSKYRYFLTLLDHDHQKRV